MTNALNVSFLEQLYYFNAINKTNLTGYLNTNPILLEEYDNFIHLKYLEPFWLPTWLYACLITIGFIGNVINIIVLTRPSMANALNLLLFYLELLNVSVLVFFVPELIGVKFFPEERQTYEWKVFSYALTCIVNGFIFASNWISVTIGMWRFIAVTWPLSASRWFTRRVAHICIRFIFVTAIALITVNICLYTVTPYVVAVYHNESSKGPLFLDKKFVQVFNINSVDMDGEILIRSIIQFFLTTIPCAISGVFSLLLIINLCKAYKNRLILSKAKSLVPRVNGSNRIPGNMTSQVERKLTIILLIILVTSNLFYLPHAILYVYLLAKDETILGSSLFNIAISGIGILLSNCFTFFIYIIMSEKFRRTAMDILFKFLRIRYKQSQPNKSIDRSESDYSRTIELSL